MADFKLGDAQVLASPFRAEKVKLTITHTVIDKKTKEKKTTEVPLGDIITRVREKYANKDDQAQDEFFDTIEPYVLIGSLVCATWGNQMQMTPPFLLTFMKGFLLGRVFGKNGLDVDLDKEDVDPDEHREYVAKLLAEKAKEMAEFAKDIADGEKELSFLDSAMLSAEDQ